MLPSRVIALQLLVSATAFSLTPVGLSIKGEHALRRAHVLLDGQRKGKAPLISPLSPVPMQTKAKPLLIPAIGYAGLAGVSLGLQQLLDATTYGHETIWNVPVPLAAVAFVVVPALFLLGEFALLGGGERVAKMMGGHPADDSLTALCSRVADRAGLPPPKHVYEIPTAELNAFAAGFGRGDATVAVTSGIRSALSTRELEAVIAHEIGHIRHSDMTTNMHAAVVIAGLGGLYELGRFLLESESNSEVERGNDDEGGAASVGLMLMLGGIATRILAHLLQLSISRGAEYDADRVAAELCGADAMISALSKIDHRAGTAPRDQLAARGNAFAHAYISNGPSRTPKETTGLRGAWEKFVRLWSTHPSTEDRIEALTRMR